MTKIELPSETKEKISQSYRTSSSLNEVIRKLNIIIDFIISSGYSNSNEKIVDYATNVLKMINPDDADFNRKVCLFKTKIYENYNL